MGAKPRDVNPCEGDVSTEDSASATNVSRNKGVNDQICLIVVSRLSQKIVYGFDSQTDVNIVDKYDIIQLLEKQWVDADYTDQEWANSVIEEVSPLIYWNNLVNRDTSGNEVMDITDSAPRLWEVEQQKGYLITQVKGRLRENFVFWWDTLKAPTPVLNCINKGYVQPMITERPAHIQANQQSALEHSDFVNEAIEDLLNNGCVQKVSAPPHVCSPHSVVCNSEDKNCLVSNLRYINRFLKM